MHITKHTEKQPKNHKAYVNYDDPHISPAPAPQSKREKKLSPHTLVCETNTFDNP